jgi:hypothetical protein
LIFSFTYIYTYYSNLITYIAHLAEIVLHKQNQFIKDLSEKPQPSNPIPLPPMIDVDQSIKSLLRLFQVQQHRVLSRVKDGGKPPQALEVAGSNVGSWHNLTKHIRVDEAAESNNSDDRQQVEVGGGGGGA